MCDFCEGKEVISREPDLREGKHTGVSLRIDEESKLYKLRMELGSTGYTLPIKANFCMFCGDKIRA
ncbi:hypothetical protein AWH56_008965 [Anaerobacillus isosaccharinicus]|uniref:Uncharacterized protein n=1 Tax=Anaerobacillus isosaccharinicus TaxID=1532552 RepID=A0A1S2L0H3_9BACI|nr:hypothetical protein [Anaerobacillus isosaccharinicus]QOY37692.1 hypothetical protein AWH56_008965 [Anaerobacillus isosaccharinicus]